MDGIEMDRGPSTDVAIWKREQERKAKMSKDLKELVLEKRKEGKLVYTNIEGLVSVDVAEFIKQPVDGILYDLNRLEEVVLTFIDDPKWINDFAVALTIRELKKEITNLQKGICGTNAELSKAWDKIEKLQDDANILQCLREAGIDNVEAYSQGMMLYYERYPEKDEEL